MATKKKTREEEKPEGQEVLATLVDNNTRVVVINEQGQTGTLSREFVESGAAQAQGWRIATQEEAHERDLEKKYGGAISNVRGGLESVARGTLFGGYDYLALKAGADPERLREERERIGLVGDILEMGGAIAPMFATGGTAGLAQIIGRGTVGTAARAAGQAGLKQLTKSTLRRGVGYATPAGLVGAAARAAEPVIAKGLAGAVGQAPGVLARGAAAGIVGAAESALYGVGQGLSEAEMMGDPDLAGELIMAKLGGNAVLGGTAATAFSLATGAIGLGFNKAAAMARAKRAKIEESVESQAFAAAQAEAAAKGELSNELQTKLSVKLEEGPDGGWKKMVQNRARQLKSHVEGGERQEELAKSIMEDMSSQNRIRNVLMQKHFNIEGKIKGFVKDFEGITPIQKNDILDHARDKVIDTIEWLDGKIAQKDYHKKASINLMKKTRDLLHNRHLPDLVEMADEPNVAKAAGRAMGIVDDVKRNMDDIGERHFRIQELRGQPVGKEIEDYANLLRKDLEDPSSWGIAVNRQVGDNRIWPNWILQAREKTRYLDEALAHEVGEGYTSIKLADYKRVLSAVKDAGTPAKEVRTLAQFAETDAQLMEQLARSHDVDLAPEALELVKQYRKLTDGITAKMRSATQLATDMGDWQKMLRQTEHLPPIVSAAKKMAITGMATADSISRLSAVANTASTTAGAVKSIVKSTVDTAQAAGKAIKTGKDVTGRVIKELIPVVPPIIEKEPEKLKEKFDKALDADKQYQDNIAILHSRLSRIVDSMADVAPDTSMALAGVVQRATEFMRSKRPEPPLRASDFMAHLQDRQRVSDSQMAKYLRYREGLDPIESMKKLAQGQISREGAETFRAVYPQMFAMVKQEFGRQLVDATEPLPLKNLLHYSILLDTPLHPSFEPTYVTLVQQMYKKEREDKKNPQGRQAPNMAENYASRSHQLV